MGDMKEAIELSAVEEERIPVAFHEEGHDLAAKGMGCGTIFVSVIPEYDSSGHTVTTA